MPKGILLEINPVLPVRDIKKSINYYVDRLGFKFLFLDSEDNPAYAGVGRDKVILHQQKHDPKEFNNVEKLNLRFVTENIEQLFEEYSQKNVFHSKTDLRKTSWGTKEFAFFDPDNNGLTFYSDLSI